MNIVEILSFSFFHLLFGSLISLGYVCVIASIPIKKYEKIIAIFILVCGIFSIFLIPLGIIIALYKILFGKD